MRLLLLLLLLLSPLLLLLPLLPLLPQDVAELMLRLPHPVLRVCEPFVGCFELRLELARILLVAVSMFRAARKRAGLLSEVLLPHVLLPLRPLALIGRLLLGERHSGMGDGTLAHDWSHEHRRTPHRADRLLVRRPRVVGAGRVHECEAHRVVQGRVVVHGALSEGSASRLAVSSARSRVAIQRRHGNDLVAVGTWHVTVV